MWKVMGISSILMLSKLHLGPGPAVLQLGSLCCFRQTRLFLYFVCTLASLEVHFGKITSNKKLAPPLKKLSKPPVLV